MAKSYIGAKVLYCGHSGTFVADIYEIAGANVVRPNGPVTMENLDRTDPDSATHHIRDFPKGGFWKPSLGVFVVPTEQVVELD